MQRRDGVPVMMTSEGGHPPNRQRGHNPTMCVSVLHTPIEVLEVGAFFVFTLLWL